MVAALATRSATELTRAAAALALGVLLAASVAVADGYLQSVRAAEQALRQPGLTASELAGIRDRLAAGTSCSQPEIATDLSVQPAQVEDARQRLAALDHALTAPAEPAPGAESRLRSLAASSPYNREQPESPGDLLTGQLQSILARLAAAACGGGLAVLLLVLRWVAVVAAGIAALVILYRLLRRYRRRGQEPAGRAGDPDRLRTAAERFASADGLAAAGDLAAALRELAGAVATVLGGEAAWDLSPLTVREIYRDAGKLGELRPLLRGFEEAVYGHRPVTPEAYAAAASAASPYRPGTRRAA